MCASCNTEVTDAQAQRRKERGFKWISCCVCDANVEIRDVALDPDFTQITTIDEIANARRDRDVVGTILDGKVATNDFDVFLCHNSEDKPDVRSIGDKLKANAILPWLDEWELRPGVPWQTALEEQIEHVKCAAVFVGESGIGPWQNFEMQAFLQEFVRRGCPVIPVLLPVMSGKAPKLPIFLRGMTWVDLREDADHNFQRLLWGITGKKGLYQGRLRNSRKKRTLT